MFKNACYFIFCPHFKKGARWVLRPSSTSVSTLRTGQSTSARCFDEQRAKKKLRAARVACVRLFRSEIRKPERKRRGGVRSYQAMSLYQAVGSCAITYDSKHGEGLAFLLLERPAPLSLRPKGVVVVLAVAMCVGVALYRQEKRASKKCGRRASKKCGVIFFSTNDRRFFVTF